MVCTTDNCQRQAVRLVEIEDVAHPYCWTCGEHLLYGGYKDIGPIDTTDETSAHLRAIVGFVDFARKRWLWGPGAWIDAEDAVSVVIQALRGEAPEPLVRVEKVPDRTFLCERCESYVSPYAAIKKLSPLQRVAVALLQKTDGEGVVTVGRNRTATEADAEIAPLGETLIAVRTARALVDRGIATMDITSWPKGKLSAATHGGLITLHEEFR